MVTFGKHEPALGEDWLIEDVLAKHGPTKWISLADCPSTARPMEAELFKVCLNMASPGICSLL